MIAGIRQRRFFFVYSLPSRDLSDHGEIMYTPFPVCCLRNGDALQAPLCPRPGLSQENMKRTKGITNDRRASVKDEGKERPKGKVLPIA